MTTVSARLVSPGVAIALLAGLAGLAGAIVVSCYAIPTPDCGFICGPGGACPESYTCADDHRCHRNGAPADLVCSTIDAPLPIDASGVDTAVDSAPDAMPDAMPDAPPDAPDPMPDAPPDAPDDAPPDAPDASIDAP